ncbi:MAG TPA: S9 family peptidase [Steroidobacteraceae bacterium]|nr:S9 family peptidase [Steroidobacteraceae bacterium]
MSRQVTAAAGLLLASFPLHSLAEPAFDAAKAFGARPSVEDLSLSPDGMNVAFVAPASGQGSVVFVQSLAKGAARVSKPILSAGGKPERLGGCDWVSNQRLVCSIYGVVASGLVLEPVEFSRLVAINADGTKLQMLSNRSNSFSRGMQLSGGNVIDWLPDEDGAVLMTRVYLPDDHTASHIGSSKHGIAVDRVDTLTLTSRTIEQPREDAVTYISDGRGTVRIMGVRSRRGALGDYASGNIAYFYRMTGSRDWLPMGEVVGEEFNGFEPVAVDHDANLAYGYKKLDGRRALYTVALDASLKEDLVYARPDVDVGGLNRIGRRHRVVGVSYSDDFSRYHFLDPAFERLLASLAKALPGQPTLNVVDSSLDENKLLIRAGSDQDPGVYYLFDKKLRQLETFFAVRGELEGVKLAGVKPIHYQAADGTMIPGYLTLPPGIDMPKDLPAIVMPHGGPSARDYWRFDWLAQFYASRGYAVLQPNFRGSTGYGDDFFNKNGFRSWPTAIGDVRDAGKWLVAQGIARADRLAVVGWSYGGYAALQSAVVDPGLFKAVIAIAPVTDLPELKEEHRQWSDFLVVSREIGEGPHVREGSPALNAAKIKVPVLLFHGEMDRNVPIRQSKEMADHLAAAGVPHELVTWPDLDHQLEDSAARAEMLRKSDAFLRRALGL